MTREEAIRRVKGYLTDCLPSDCYEEVEEIIKALEQESTKNDLGDEYISRSELMAILSDYYDTTVEYRSMLREIAALPSVTPQEPKAGHWIKGYTFPDGAYWKCDKCNELIKVKIPMRYCNNCGAKMVEPQESEEP